MPLIEIKSEVAFSLDVFPQFSQPEEDALASSSFVERPCRSYKARRD